MVKNTVLHALGVDRWVMGVVDRWGKLKFHVRGTRTYVAGDGNRLGCSYSVRDGLLFFRKEADQS